MTDEEKHPSFDPYQPLDQNLKFADVLNRLMLLRPRQKIVQLLKGQRVLDVCCGTGNLTAMLVAAGCQAVGIDSSPTMLSHARRKHIAAEFEQMDAIQLPFNHEFDAAVISIALHEMLPLAREKVWGIHALCCPSPRAIDCVRLYSTKANQPLGAHCTWVYGAR